MRETAARLQAAGIRPSYQRIRIYECLAATSAHPHAEAIWQDLVAEIPSLSRTTVYSTLGLFVRSGLALPILIDGGELRYDADTSEHGHFRCRSCGRVLDFPVDGRDFTSRLPEGFSPELVQLYCVGLCPDCVSGRGQ
jgi:Fur family transcriptional regulator, peroxide stress response regulator